MVIAYALLGNGVSGVIFGRLYWRRGLAALACPVTADLVLKAALPLPGIG